MQCPQIKNIYAMSTDKKDVSDKILSLTESIQDEIKRTGRELLRKRTIQDFFERI